jgi:hypothetical protein
MNKVLSIFSIFLVIVLITTSCMTTSQIISTKTVTIPETTYTQTIISTTALTISTITIPETTYTQTITSTTALSTSTITVPETTNTQTLNYMSINNFLSGIQNSYKQGTNIPGQSPLVPRLKGISESDFLSLTVNDLNISLNHISYKYVAFSPMSDVWLLPAKIKIGSYQIYFTVPTVTTVGGTPILVQIYNSDNSGVPFGTTFIFYYIPVEIGTSSVYVERQVEGDLQFFFMYYYSPESRTENNMWLILLPTS